MTADETNALINDLKATVTSLTAKVADLQARTVLTDQQAADLKAAVEALVQLGK